jgi:hypothetical protein
MINIALDQNDITTRRSPTGHVTGLPPSPPQAKWQGRPSPGVEAVLSRDAALDGSYLELFAPWASNLALLSSQFVQQVCQTKIEQPSSIKSVDTHWSFYKVYDLAQCDVGPHSLWLKKQLAGWSVELRYPCDIDGRVLTIENMPVLCPDLTSARKVALANYPNSVGGLTWRPCT